MSIPSGLFSICTLGVAFCLMGCNRGKDSGVDCSSPPTYNSWTQGFLDGKCQSCHASTAPDRHGAPPNVAFDNRTLALEWQERIAATILEEGSMPPSGGITDEEMILLEQWIECGEEEE